MKQNWLNLRFAQLALSFGITFSVFSFMGYWGGSALDSRLGSEPWLMIIGMSSGAIFAFYSLIKEIMIVHKFSAKDQSKGKK